MRPAQSASPDHHGSWSPHGSLSQQTGQRSVQPFLQSSPMCGYVCPIHRPRCCGICSNRPHQREARVCGVTAASDPMASSQYSQTWLRLASAYTLCRVHSSYLGTLKGNLLIEQRRRRLPYRTKLQSRLEVNSFTRNPFRAQYREKYSKIFPYVGLRNGIRATGLSDVTETTSGQQTHATDRPCIPGGRKVQYQLRLHVRGGGKSHLPGGR